MSGVIVLVPYLNIWKQAIEFVLCWNVYRTSLNTLNTYVFLWYFWKRYFVLQNFPKTEYYLVNLPTNCKNCNLKRIASSLFCSIKEMTKVITKWKSFSDGLMIIIYYFPVYPHLKVYESLILKIFQRWIFRQLLVFWNFLPIVYREGTITELRRIITTSITISHSCRLIKVNK